MNRAVQWTGPQKPLVVEDLLERAIEVTKLRDFGGTRFHDPLRRLVDALEGEARLSAFGRVIARTRLHGHLVNRLLLTRDECRMPEILGEEIRAPIVIAGPPRTGTTILFHLIAQDPARLSPLAWKLQYPSPPPGRSARRIDRRVLAQKGREYFLHGVLPELKKVYRTAAVLPEECVVMKGHEFTTIMFSIAYRVPSYEAWLLDCDHAESYRMHRRFLQHLQYGVSDASWVLKSPEHLLSLDDLFGAYPDACLVQTHRDPVEVLPSLSSLTAILRSMCSDDIDRTVIGRETEDFWSIALARAAAFRQKMPELRDRIFDVRFEDICDDPMGVVQAIYDHFGFELSPRARARMHAFLAENPRGKYGEHRYCLGGFGLDRAELANRFAAYRAEMGYCSQGTC